MRRERGSGSGVRVEGGTREARERGGVFSSAGPMAYRRVAAHVKKKARKKSHTFGAWLDVTYNAKGPSREMAHTV